jgi:hypothetical protein
MYTMILVITLFNKALSVSTISFSSESSCFQAISKSLEMENASSGIKIKARCVKK